MTRHTWDLLCVAENDLYEDRSRGWTRTYPFETFTSEDSFLSVMWSVCEANVDAGENRDAETAKRVAASLAALSYGPEFVVPIPFA